jgi:hypothetical protein
LLTYSDFISEHYLNLIGDDPQKAKIGPEVLRHPELKDHFYQRKIGNAGDNDWYTKIAMGSPGHIIEKR